MIPNSQEANQGQIESNQNLSLQINTTLKLHNELRGTQLGGNEQQKIKQELKKDLQAGNSAMINQDQMIQEEPMAVETQGKNEELKRKRKRSMKQRKVRTIITKEKLLKMNEVFTQYIKQKNHIANGEVWTLKKIAGQLGLGYSTILHKYRQFRANKKVKAGTLISSRQRKRKYKKSVLVEQCIQKALQERQFFTASQMTFFIQQKYGIKFSRSIISRHLGQMGYSYKNVSQSVRAIKPQARYDAIHKSYAELMIPLIQKNQTLIFVDQLSCCFTNGQNNQNNIVSVLLACTIHGVLFFHIQQGFFNRMQFYQITKKFFGNLKESSFCQNIQGENGELYLVLDLNKIHRDDSEGKPGLAQMLVQQNIELYYIPPATTQLNPIEPIFEKIRQKMKQKISNNGICSLKQTWQELQNIMDEMQHQSTDIYFMQMYDRLQILMEIDNKK